MKLLIIRSSASCQGTLSIGGPKVLALGIGLLLVLPTVLGVSSYWLAAKADRAVNPFVDPEYRQEMEALVSDQKQQIADTRAYVNQHMDALGRKIGSLQAQVSRINAVEMRIAELAKIDLDNFDFESDPPVGGSSAADESSAAQRDIQNAIADIQYQLDESESQVAVIDFMLSARELGAQKTPSGWPVKGGWISSKFGTRMHPLTGRKHFHRGVDIPGRRGSHVLTVGDGVVKRSEKKGNYGWLVEIDHGDGLRTLYSHNEGNLVKVGETVSKGQPIAILGSTGRSTGPHVHFEVLVNDRNVNPIKYLYRRS